MLLIKTRQIILYCALAFLAFIVIVTSLLNQSVDQANKQLGLITPRPMAKIQQKVDILVPPHGNYSLIASGMLPTNPLYPLKMVVDRLKLIISLNPEQHTRRLLAYSNMRMSAANQLIEEGETDLAVSTATKGQTYMWQAISQSQTIPPSQRVDWYDSLEQALLKHEEVIEKIRLVAHDASQNQIQHLWEQLAEYRQQVANLSGKPFMYPRPDDLPTADSASPYL